MDIKNIKFKSPRDIKEGEYFSFDELYSSDENMESLLEANKEVIKNKVNLEMNSLKDELKIKLNEKEEELRVHFERKEQEAENKAKQQVENEVKLAEAKLESKLRESEVRVEMLVKSESEKNDIIKTMKDTYESILEEKLNNLRTEFSKEKENLIKEYEDKRLSNATIGDDAEEEIRQKLKNIFPNDIIEKPNHAIGGADVLHSIVHNGKDICKVYYEVKNRKNWSKADYENFADKVRREDHSFNIYIAQALPKQSKDQSLKQFNEELFYDEVNNIYLTSFNNWLPVIAVIRRQAIETSQLIKNNESINDIKERVYTFFKSPDFLNYFNRLKTNFKEMDEVFKAIQKKTIDGKTINERASLEISNLEADINAKLNES